MTLRFLPPVVSSARALALAGALCAATAMSAAEAGAGFDYQELQYRARNLAAKPYVAQNLRVPEWLQQLSYDEHRDIRFRPERTWWRAENLPFQLQFFHPGCFFHETVQIHELNDKDESEIAFNPGLFDYGKNRIKRIPRDMGFAGFRVHYPLNRPDYYDELIVFLGASYFRALGQGQHYGLSARGLAIDTAEKTTEEFPIFIEFWIERPAAGAKDLTLYALLDSRRVAGAFRFRVEPGKTTSMRIKSTIFLREPVATLGLAPLTSMFWHGENSPTHNNDYRPEVHDSDGLLVAHGSGEWLWRPLTNPAQVRVAHFATENPRGFGLLQRDRNFDHYQDLEAHQQARPTAWVEPLGNWGRGTVRLVELPTPEETNDNIVAFWVPEKQPAPGEPLEYEYDLKWTTDLGKRPPGGYTVATRPTFVMGRPELRRFVVDFEGHPLQVVASGVEGVVTVGDGATLDGVQTQRNPINGSWRLVFSLKPDGSGRPVDLRAFLRKDDNVLSETWSYLWQP